MKLYIVLYFILAVIFACLTMYLAVRKGKKPLPWFFIGLIFSLFGFIVAFFITDKIKK